MFDFIYIDGSHHSDDVLIDGIKCFQALKSGGIMIFDDYMWTFYERMNDNPVSAINAFIKLKSDQIKVLRVYHQLILLKK